MSIRTARLDYVPGLRQAISIFPAREAAPAVPAKPPSTIARHQAVPASRRRGAQRRRPLADSEAGRLFEKLRAQGRTAQWIATQLGVSTSTLYAWAAGTEPGAQSLERLRALAQ